MEPLEQNSDKAIPHHDARFASRNRLVITILIISTFIVILNETLMIVAIPYLMNDLGVSASAAQWLTTAFLLTMAVVIPITGFLLQRINTKPAFILAMSLFSLGTLIAALSSGLEMLVVGRVIQATGTAVMMPLLMTTIMMLVPPESRGKFMGNISLVIAVAPAVGPTVAGFILSHFEWPWLFWTILPIALSALILGYVRIVNVSTPRYAPLDILSVLLSMVAFGGLVYGLSALGQVEDGDSSLALNIVIVGAIGMALFIWRQIRLQPNDKALLDLRTFQSRGFTLSLAMMTVAMMLFFGSLILLPIYIQKVQMLDTLQTGLIFLPGGLVMGLLAPFVGALYDKHGPRLLIIPGAFVVSGVLWAMTLLNAETWWGYILIGHILISGGLAFITTPLFTASLSSIPQKFYSHGSAILGSIQQLAGAAGIALLVAIMTLQTNALISEGVTPINALAGGISKAFIWGAAFSIVMILTAFFVPNDKPSQQLHEEME